MRSCSPTLVVCFTLFIAPASAQQQQPSPYEQIADDNIHMGDMQRVIGTLQKQALALQNDREKLTAQLADSRELNDLWEAIQRPSEK